MALHYYEYVASSTGSVVCISREVEPVSNAHGERVWPSSRRGHGLVAKRNVNGAVGLTSV